MILLWGPPRDSALAAVARELMRLNVSVLALDTPDVQRVDLEPSPNNAGAGAMILQRGHRVDLGGLAGLYLRPHSATTDIDLLRATDALLAWSDMTTAVTVNRPAASASNHSKPYQAKLIAKCGFNVPDTLLTTDPGAALAFWAAHGQVIYKSISGIRSIVRRLDDADRDRLGDVASCPVQLQQHIAGTDYRVHVVGSSVFACAVRSTATDYRYASGTDAPIEIQGIELPADTANRCRTLTVQLGLDLAGIDLRLDGTGQWWCFEVNTAPGFSWYEQQTGQPIAHAIATHLTRGAEVKSRSRRRSLPA